MSTRNGVLLVLALAAPVAAHAASYGLGRAATESEIAGWNIDVAPDGTGLPPGSGSVAQGKQLYESVCAACHGMKGEGKPADRLVGGKDTLKTGKPVRTVGSFWPYATTLYDYIRRAMPYTAPQSLSADQVYAVSAYLLHLNGIVPEGTMLDAQSLAKVRMPNRDGFVGDPRPDVVNVPCRSECK